MKIKTFITATLALLASAASAQGFIKNVVKSPRIIIGDYTYYDDVDIEKIEANFDALSSGNLSLIRTIDK